MHACMHACVRACLLACLPVCRSLFFHSILQTRTFNCSLKGYKDESGNTTFPIRTCKDQIALDAALGNEKEKLVMLPFCPLKSTPSAQLQYDIGVETVLTYIAEYRRRRIAKRLPEQLKRDHQLDVGTSIDIGNFRQTTNQKWEFQGHDFDAQDVALAKLKCSLMVMLDEQEQVKIEDAHMEASSAIDDESQELADALDVLHTTATRYIREHDLLPNRVVIQEEQEAELRTQLGINFTSFHSNELSYEKQRVHKRNAAMKTRKKRSAALIMMIAPLLPGK
jgi:hypothetical protein